MPRAVKFAALPFESPVSVPARVQSTLLVET